MGAKRRKPTPGGEPPAAELPEPPERWSAAQKTELVLRLLRGEALDAVSRESQVPAHELESWKRVFLSRALLALAAFEPVVSLPRDTNVAEASGQLADEVQSWRSQLRDCVRSVSGQQERVSEAEAALHSRNEEADKARRRRDELTETHQRRVGDLDAYLKEHARALVMGEWGPEFQLPAYRLCRAFNVRLPWDLILPSDKELTKLKGFVVRALRK